MKSPRGRFQFIKHKRDKSAKINKTKWNKNSKVQRKQPKCHKSMGVYGHKTKKYEQHTHPHTRTHICPHKRMPFINTWCLGEYLLAKTNRFGEGKTWKATAKEAERLFGARLHTFAGHKSLKKCTCVHTYAAGACAEASKIPFFDCPTRSCAQDDGQNQQKNKKEKKRKNETKKKEYVERYK